MKNLNLKPDDFLKFIVETINKTGKVIELEEFNVYVENKPEVWNTDQYGNIFYMIHEYLMEGMPKSVYDLSDLQEDISSYLNKKKLA